MGASYECILILITFNHIKLSLSEFYYTCSLPFCSYSASHNFILYGSETLALCDPNDMAELSVGWYELKGESSDAVSTSWLEIDKN